MSLGYPAFAATPATNHLAYPLGPAQAAPDASDAFFADPHMPLIEITISGDELKSLEKEPRKYAKATVREDDRFVYDAVGVHLKGAAGSYRGLGDRPALTLNFDKFRKGQSFHGLDKLHLNNSVQDGSLMNEAICRWLSLAAGVPAGRATHARVRLNGRDLGLYGLVEGTDRTWLRRHFFDVNGHLYDGGFCQDLDGQKKALSNHTPAGQAELKALWNAAQMNDPVVRVEALERQLDADQFLRFVAVELMTSHWDGYVMNRNNYRMYVDTASGRTHFFPAGMDQMFGDSNYNLFQHGNGLICRRIMEVPRFRERYRELAGVIFTNAFHLETLHARVDALAAKLKPYGNYDGHASGMKQRLAARSASLARQLGAPDPNTLRFDKQGRVKLDKGWFTQTDGGSPKHETLDAHGRKCLYLKAGGQTVASWRRKILLEAGKYEFEAMARTAGVSKSGEAFSAVGIRISGGSRTRKLEGTTDWQRLGHVIETGGPREVVLVCEIRAGEGEAWFDLNSLALVRK